MPESKRRKTKKSARPQSMAMAAATKAKAEQPSATWYVVLMCGLIGLGVAGVLARFIFDWNQLWMFGGLLAIAAGFLMTTNYR
jgi:hypothetical protein